MKRTFLLTAIFALFAIAVSAQDKAPNFGGTWNLDVAKSKLGDRNTIETQTMTVTQTDKDIKIETSTKRKAPPEGAPPPGGMGGGRPGGMGGGMMGGGDMPMTYALDGKETKTEIQGPMGAMPVSLKAKFEAGKLHLLRSSTFNGPMGEMTMTTNETFELSADGNTLTVNTTRNSPRGTDTTTKVFAKKT